MQTGLSTCRFLLEERARNLPTVAITTTGHGAKGEASQIPAALACAIAYPRAFPVLPLTLRFIEGPLGGHWGVIGGLLGGPWGSLVHGPTEYLPREVSEGPYTVG